jgi:hypothetical protein
MPADRRRHAAALAAYLAQFDFIASTNSAEEGNRPGYAEAPDEERTQRHLDYLQAIRWAHTSVFTDDDVHELAVICRRYGFRLR